MRIAHRIIRDGAMFDEPIAEIVLVDGVPVERLQNALRTGAFVLEAGAVSAPEPEALAEPEASFRPAAVIPKKRR